LSLSSRLSLRPKAEYLAIRKGSFAPACNDK
jgi:hypothetical protein